VVFGSTTVFFELEDLRTLESERHSRTQHGRVPAIGCKRDLEDRPVADLDLRRFDGLSGCIEQGRTIFPGGSITALSLGLALERDHNPVRGFVLFVGGISGFRAIRFFEGLGHLIVNEADEVLNTGVIVAHLQLDPELSVFNELGIGFGESGPDSDTWRGYLGFTCHLPILLSWRECLAEEVCS
jgi:hypothetical protein